VRRYWVDKEFFTPDHVVITGDTFHHIFDVCRQTQGSQFEVLDGMGNAYLVEAIALEKKKAICKILSQRQLPRLAHPHIHLALSISRYPIMDNIVEKAVELGVHSIHPFFSEFSFVRKRNSLPDNKIERWKKIVISATQQSGRGDLMKVEEPIELIQVLKNYQQATNRSASTLGLFAYEGNTDLGLGQYLRQKVQSKGTDELWIFVGSEGGFSGGEVQEFQTLNLSPVTLGDQVLRVETACITLIAILKYEFGLFR